MRCGLWGFHFQYLQTNKYEDARFTKIVLPGARWERKKESVLKSKNQFFFSPALQSVSGPISYVGPSFQITSVLLLLPVKVHDSMLQLLVPPKCPSLVGNSRYLPCIQQKSQLRTLFQNNPKGVDMHSAGGSRMKPA